MKLEYPEGLYDSMNSLMDATLTNNQGIQVPSISKGCSAPPLAAGP
ncbi:MULTISPECIES: hypothetical protein [Eisenbergiella]|nr:MULTISPECIES: hypothetical protein [Eisenbergiella]MDY2651833.1 hypothetical protein [Eisenbergiella porci]